MKLADVEVGKLYWAQVSGRMVKVRVDGQQGPRKTVQVQGSNVIWSKRRVTTRFNCTNTLTGKKLMMTAARMRSEAKASRDISDTPITPPITDADMKPLDDVMRQKIADRKAGVAGGLVTDGETLLQVYRDLRGGEDKVLAVSMVDDIDHGGWRVDVEFLISQGSYIFESHAVAAALTAALFKNKLDWQLERSVRSRKEG